MFDLDLKKYLGIELSENQKKQFELYYAFLIEYNKITNLTTITDKNEVYYKHFFDSMSLIKSIDLTKIKTLCDMGAGAGFPSIPLKIIYTDLEITIIDSLGKRITFLNQLVEKLSLNQVNIVNDRIEVYGKTHKEQFDLVTARALGHMSMISEYALPMTKTNGHFIAYKSSQHEVELEISKKAIGILGGQIEQVVTFDLPNDYGKRSLIKVKKVKKCPDQYPRSFAAIKKNSL